MSKRKKNYPDPMEIVNKYGADALRWVQQQQQLKGPYYFKTMFYLFYCLFTKDQGNKIRLIFPNLCTQILFLNNPKIHGSHFFTLFMLSSIVLTGKETCSP